MHYIEAIRYAPSRLPIFHLSSGMKHRTAMANRDCEDDPAAGGEDFELAQPPAASMMEALRGLGYNVRTAIADLIDNSISAGASTIWLTFHWNGRDSWMSLLDDGRGMSEKELSDAMRPGSANPLTERSSDDLGRFGLGLKTASFSQCRALTVASRQSDKRAVRRWDLDYVLTTNEWRVLLGPEAASAHKLGVLDPLKSGTVVLWEKMDRLVGDVDVNDKHAGAAFHEMIESVRRHLGMVFHRYLEGAQPSLRISINGGGPEHRVHPWDPFLAHHNSTITTPAETLTSSAGVVVVRGYVLPHKDRLGSEMHAAASGIEGWNAQQGFYVYRNRRLLVAGSWLDLGWTKEEHYKLARIAIDIPNNVDAQWKIDVRKSTARPPSAIRHRLKVLAERVRSQARDVFSHRGAYRPRQTADPVIKAWSASSAGGRLVYRINRDHPVVIEWVERSDDTKARTDRLLRVIEATVPVHQIWLDMAEKPDEQARPFEEIPDQHVLPLMQQLYDHLRISAGMGAEPAKGLILRTEPFNSYSHLLNQLKEP